MNLESYKKLLEAHNWKYLDSKDKNVIELGTKTKDNLIRLASENSEFRRAYFSMKEKMLPSCGH